MARVLYGLLLMHPSPTRRKRLLIDTVSIFELAACVSGYSIDRPRTLRRVPSRFNPYNTCLKHVARVLYGLMLMHPSPARHKRWLIDTASVSIFELAACVSGYSIDRPRTLRRVPSRFNSYNAYLKHVARVLYGLLLMHPSPACHKCWLFDNASVCIFELAACVSGYSIDRPRTLRRVPSRFNPYNIWLKHVARVLHGLLLMHPSPARHKC